MWILTPYIYLVRFLLAKKNYKYFIGCIDDDCKIKPFSIILPKTGTYVKRYDDETKWMYFLIEDDEFIKKCNDIWNKASDSIKKQFHSEPSYNKKFL